MLSRLVRHWPVLVVLLFCAYATALLHNAFQAQGQLRVAADARVVADKQRVSLVLADVLAERRRIVKMNDECRPLLRALMEAVDRYQAHEQDLVMRGALEANATVRQERALLLLAGLLSVGVALGLGWALSDAVTRPLHAAVATARAVADGDLTARAQSAGRDETGQLLVTLQEMSLNLRTVVTSVRATADGVAGASSEIANGNNDLSARTEQQASALQQTAATMQHMTTMVQQNAEHSQRATELSSAAAGAAEQGGQLVRRVVSTMGEISTASDEIGQIIGVIDSIAFQTNILALNAAVEAARAGEQGRGFAVVASEVRALAHRSAEAAKQVHRLVHASLLKVKSGEALVSEAGCTMDAIVQQVKAVNALVAGINGATGQQSTGIAEINAAIGSIDQGTQQNAALVEEGAAAAENLKQQAGHLVQMLTRFKTAPAS
ncbi:methyl-accepting chemotaxis protein [Aquincola sp. J276]|uniref:methyl-accepting chemotaxis protein n=1 Tax=Aquincola sp. J276 TaxID=2898432 RepID=UPI0021508BA5|nr:methyl-accepting chemotaxis protein [Aquincola sp. J276]MCR5868166.1 methyl-accepting chemotaxis protein [Aquincola sp. J276]